jgi:hypothetical protein
VTVILTGFEAAGDDLRQERPSSGSPSSARAAGFARVISPSPSSSSTPVGSAVKMA